jgi:hypothetical protein
MELFAKAGKENNETVKRVSCYANVICRIEKPSPGSKKDSTEEDKWTLTTILIAVFVSRLPKLPHSRHDAASESSSGTATEAPKRQFWAVLFPPGKRVLAAVKLTATIV